MKLLTLLCVIVVGASGYLIKVPTLPQPIGPAAIENVDWIQRQKTILSLFDNVCDPSNDVAIIRLAKGFSMDPMDYRDPNVVVRLQTLMSGKGLLPKQEIFSEYNSDHLTELQVVSEVLCNARDFDLFFNAAAWARQNVNCGVFVDAIYTAVIKRRDTHKLSIPAPYELLPNYFVRKDAVIAGAYLLTGTTLDTANVREDGNAYIITTNYTTDINELILDERQMAYFFEDVGLNTYLFLRKLSLVPWMNYLNNVDSTYGEYLYHVMKNLAARYDLERYSNGLEEVQGVQWDVSKELPYNPMLIYSNGEDFRSREGSIDFSATASITFLKNVEENIATAVTHMKQNSLTKSQILNNLMEILVVGSKNYEALALKLLSNTKDIKGSPSALEHYMTAARDPIFWKLNKKIVNIIDNALRYIPTYSRSELYFPGVEVVNVEIKKMVTSFDNFEIDTTDALRALHSESTFQIKMEQPRLNHKTFSLKVNISSLVAQKGLMKIYLGPKILPGELAVNKNKFMLLDACEITLKKGSNAITRSSEDMKNLSIDFLSLKTLYKNVEDAEFGLGSMPQENVGRLVGFPSRLVVPKGTEEGLPLQVFVFVAPLVRVTVNELGSTNMEFNAATQSPGYPLDLIIENGQLFDLPNVIVKETIVIHKSLKQSDSDGSSPPTTWNGGNSYDYASKRGQYGQEKGYLSKRPESSYGKPLLQKKAAGKLDKKVKKDAPEIKDVILNPFDTMPLIDDIPQKYMLESTILGKTDDDINVQSDKEAENVRASVNDNFQKIKGVQINSGVNKMINKNFDMINKNIINGVDIKQNVESKLNIYGKKDVDKNIQVTDGGIMKNKNIAFNANNGNEIDYLGKRSKDIQINTGVNLNRNIGLNINRNFDLTNTKQDVIAQSNNLINPTDDRKQILRVNMPGKKDPTIKISDDGVVKTKDIVFKPSDANSDESGTGEIKNTMYNKNFEINTDGSLNKKDVIFYPNAVSVPESNFIIDKPDKTIQIVDNGTDKSRDIVIHPYNKIFDKSLDDSSLVDAQGIVTNLQGKKAFKKFVDAKKDQKILFDNDDEVEYPSSVNDILHKAKDVHINSGVNKIINKDLNRNQVDGVDIYGKKDFDQSIQITDGSLIKNKDFTLNTNNNLIGKKDKGVKINTGVNINRNLDVSNTKSNVNMPVNLAYPDIDLNGQIVNLLGKKDPTITISDDGFVKNKDIVFNPNDANSNESGVEGIKDKFYNKNIEINTDGFQSKKDIILNPIDSVSAPETNLIINKPNKTVQIVDNGTEKTRDVVIQPFNIVTDKYLNAAKLVGSQGIVTDLQEKKAYKKFLDAKEDNYLSKSEYPELIDVLEWDTAKKNSNVNQKLGDTMRIPTVYDYLFNDYGDYYDQRGEVYE